MLIRSTARLQAVQASMFAFECKACGSREVTLFAIESQAELDEIQQALAGPKQPAQAPTTHARPDPDRGLI